VSKAPSPLLGFNNNIKHKGKLFHVQTEDSGVRHPHVITHLFMDGGRILKTVKTSYAEHIGTEGMGEIVRKLMKEQHKAMFVALRDGVFDELIAKGTSGAIAAAAAAMALKAVAVPEPSASGPQPAAVEQEAASSAGAASAARAMGLARTVAASAPMVARAGQTAPEKGPEAQQEPQPAPPSDEARRAEQRSAELSTLERVAVEARRSPSVIPPYGQGQGDLPPPPASVLQKPALEGGYSEVAPTNETRRRTAPPTIPPPPVAPAEPPVSHPPEPERRGAEPAPTRQGSGRYSVSRPTSPFAASRPPEGRSIFGEDLISEKSLDEVILSYLAEDLDTTPPKK
jgi:hypothetical protein